MITFLWIVLVVLGLASFFSMYGSDDNSGFAFVSWLSGLLAMILAAYMFFYMGFDISSKNFISGSFEVKQVANCIIIIQDNQKVRDYCNLESQKEE